MNQVLQTIKSVMRDHPRFALESRAGLTTFLTMGYILFVNPTILGNAIDVDKAQLISATALCAAFGSILMGLMARYPFAQAPGMGLNAFFTYTMVGHMGMSWQTALACVFVSGILFIVLSIAGVRHWIIEAVPYSLKYAMAAGIGLFLAIIGLSDAQIIVDHEVTLVALGNLTNAAPLICLSSLIVTSYGLMRGWNSAILLGIAFGTITAIVTGADVYNGDAFTGLTDGVAAMPVLPTDLMFAFDLGSLANPRLIEPVILLLFVDFFDTAGTLYGLAGRAGYLDQNHRLPRASQAFLADAFATAFSGIMGSSSTTTYIESASGIESGGRSGWVAVVVGLLFLAAMFFWPLVSAVPMVATSAALIVVGAMMLQSIVQIPWNDPLHAIPAFLTIVMMPLTYSISNGIAFGIMSYGFLSLLSGKFTKTNLIMQAFTFLLVLKFAFW